MSDPKGVMEGQTMTGHAGEIQDPSKGDLRILRRIAAEDVTWRSDMAGRRSFRLWRTETDYLICTPAAKRVIERGWAKAIHGYVHGRGGVELTDLGRIVLTEHFGRHLDHEEGA